MSTSFAVDAVTPVVDRLPTVSLRSACAGLLGVELEALSHDVDVVDDAMAGLFGKRVHPLIACVHRAFAEHRPLSLSPDHIWLTIARGFADHVDEHAEALRARVVRHEGRARVAVAVTERPGSAAQWAAAVDAFAAGIAAHTGPGLVRMLGCEFSTTTTVERVASRVVTMAAFKKYFDYRLVCICGIPRITLEGTVDDWREIRRRVDVVAEYDLQWWAAALRPVCDALVETAAGRPDPEFWRSIYKPAEAYGGDVATGWLMRLFPYHHGVDGDVRRSHIFDDDGLAPLEPAVPKLLDRLLRRAPAQNPWICTGVDPSLPAAGLSVAPVVLEHTSGPSVVEEGVRLYAGFCGFRQLPDGALRPEVAWGVGPPPPSTAAIDRLLASASAPLAERAAGTAYDEEMPAALSEFYDRCDGVVVGDVVLWPRAALQRGDYSTAFGTVGGRQIAFCFGRRDRVFVFVGAEGAHPEDAFVVADSIEEFFALLGAHAPLAARATLYARLPSTVDVLRRALLRAEGPPCSDLDRREQEELAMRLCGDDGTAQQRAFWWASLVATLHLTLPQQHYFGRGPPFAALERLGLR